MRARDETVRSLIAEQAAEWHVAHSEGDLRPQQAREFMRWLRASPIHVEEYLSITRVAKEVSEAARTSTASWQDLPAGDDDTIRQLGPDSDDGASRREVVSPRAYRAATPRAAPPARTRARPALRWAQVGAMLVVLFAALLVAWIWLDTKPATETFATQHGQERSLLLPDRTRVQLDSDSAITVRFDHSRRRVSLDRGQAYFQVAKGARPFSVRVGHSLIRDIGTAFDVYRRPSDTTITVAAGHVRVWNIQHPPTAGNTWLSWFETAGKPRGTPIADLGAGEQVRVTAAGQVTTAARVDVPTTLAWKDGRIAFDNAPVASVAAQFNRYNDVQIHVTDPRIAALPISGVFDARDVPTFIAFLDSLPNVRTETHGSSIDVNAGHPGSPHRNR